MKRFCVNCGIEESATTPIIRGLCPKCYTEIRGLVTKPSSIELEYCKVCGGIKVHGKWVYVQNAEELRETIEDFFIELLKPSEDFILEDIEITFTPYEDSPATINLFGKLGGTKISHAITVNVSWKASLCPLCKKVVGGSYNAVVQLRYINTDSEIERFVNSIVKEFELWIKEVKPVKNGYDIMLLDASLAKRIAEAAKRKWQAVRVMESYGDTRRTSSGLRVSRFYISIRILNFKSGDYIVVNGIPYTVVSFDGSWLNLRDSSGGISRVHIDEISRNLSKYRVRKSI
uniref:Nmd3 N-terminal domain-containing protein n=1 Tax=Ignisphaera aggregans TaxID=334771 RepID=A0A7J2U5B6_9CREN